MAADEEARKSWDYIKARYGDPARWGGQLDWYDAKGRRSRAQGARTIISIDAMLGDPSDPEILRIAASDDDESLIKPPNADRLFDHHVWPYWCIREISFAWDQWMRCRIVCTHGTYRGVSRGLLDGMGESLATAFEKFRAADAAHDRDEP